MAHEGDARDLGRRCHAAEKTGLRRMSTAEFPVKKQPRCFGTGIADAFARLVGVIERPTINRWRMQRFFVVFMAAWAVVVCERSAEARPRRPSAAQIKKMQEELQYRQQEMLRYQNAVAAKEREVYLSYDENGNDKLEGAELAKYRKYTTAVQNGKEPNPLASIPLPGQGPRQTGKK